MASRPSIKSRSKGFAREWLELAGLKQADLVRMLDWSKAKANAVWHGEQRLNEDVLEELAPLVNAHTYELLISPALAMQFRRLRAAVVAVAEDAKAPEAEPAPPARGRKAS